MTTMLMTRAIRTACLAFATTLFAASAGAQSAQARAQVPDDLDARIDRAIHDALDPRAAAALADVIRDAADAADAARSVALLDAHDISRAVTDAVKDAKRSGVPAWNAIGQRDFTARQVDRQTKTLQLGPNGQLRIDNVSGDITIAAGAGAQTTLEIVRTSRGRTDADAKAGLDRVQVNVDERAGRATITSSYPNLSRPPYSVDIEYHVTAPAGTEIDASAVSGDIKVSGMRGDVTANAISGEVAVDNSGGGIDAHTVSGDVTIIGAKTDREIAAGTTSGTVSIRQSRARRVSADSTSDDLSAIDVECDAVTMHTISGNVTFSGPLAAHGRYDLQTHSGDVHVLVDGKTGVEFDARTFSGNIRSDLTLQVTGVIPRGIRRTLHGTLGDGSASVSVTTFSGDILLQKKQ